MIASSASSLPGTLAALLLAGLLAVMLFCFSRTVSDTLGLFVVAFGVFYLFRAVLLATGLDGPSPDYLFSTTNVSMLVTQLILGLCAFVAMVGLGAAAVLGARERSGPQKRSLLFVRHEVPQVVMLRVTVVLSAFTLLVSIALMVRFGGFAGLLNAAKVSKDVGGLYFLKVPMYVGAIVATATVLDLRRQGSTSIRLWLAAGCAVLDAVMVFAWGQRSAIVIVVAMLVIGGGARASGRPVSLAQSLARLALASVLVVSLAAGLRVVRDEITRGEVNTVYATGNIWRQTSLAVNGGYFDASLLALRDWPADHEYRVGEDFYNGIVGTAPRAIYPDKPAPSPGAWFRQVYEPKNRNGWPVGAPTIWYMNFGPLGLLIGGLLSGMALGWVARHQRSGSPSAINVGVSFVIGLLVFQLGLQSDVLLRLATWLLPVIFVVAVLNWLHSRSNDPLSGGGQTVYRPGPLAGRRSLPASGHGAGGSRFRAANSSQSG